MSTLSSVLGSTFAGATGPAGLAGNVTNATTSTQLKSNISDETGSGQLVFATTPTITNLQLAAGTASLPPMKITNGVVTTTAQAGSLEYDGVVPYFSIKDSTRGSIPSEQIIVLNANNALFATTAYQPIFDSAGLTLGDVTLPVGTYMFECFFYVTNLFTGIGGSSFGFAIGGSSVKTSSWHAISFRESSVGSGGTPFVVYTDSNSDSVICATNTQTNGWARINGTIRISYPGSICPQISLSVISNAVIMPNSYFKIYPVSGSDTFTKTGNWA